MLGLSYALVGAIVFRRQLVTQFTPSPSWVARTHPRSLSASLDLLGYSDSDFVGSRVDRKSTSGGYHLLGHSLVSWSSKKQNFMALSAAEAEYIAASACCAQILYMKQTLLDFGVKLDRIPLLFVTMKVP